MNDYDVVAKISIVPRGPAGGVTIFMPSEERLNSGLYSKELLWDQRESKFESLHPGRLTWNLRIHPWKRKNIWTLPSFSGSSCWSSGV